MCLHFRQRSEVDAEISEVLRRPRFARAISPNRCEQLLRILRHAAVWFQPADRIADCRDPKDNKYLELALAAGADTIVSSDDDLVTLDPWRGVRALRPADYLIFSQPSS